jgi:hypothetical protein
MNLISALPVESVFVGVVGVVGVRHLLCAGLQVLVAQHLSAAG